MALMGEENALYRMVAKVTYRKRLLVSFLSTVFFLSGAVLAPAHESGKIALSSSQASSVQSATCGDWSEGKGEGTDFRSILSQPGSEAQSNALAMRNDKVRFSISLEHGNLLDGYKGGTRIVDNCFDEYVPESLRTRSNESKDRVDNQEVETLANGDQHLVLGVTNVDLDIGLTKEYWLKKDETRLIKKVTVRPGHRDGFLRLRSVVNLDLDFRRGSFYYTPTNYVHLLSGMKDQPGLVRARDVIEEVVFGTFVDNRLATAFNLGSGIGIGHYRLRVNDVYSPVSTVLDEPQFHPSRDSHLVYTTTGWSFETLIVGKNDQTLSSEVNYLLYDGDYLDFFRLYKDLPAYKEVNDYQVPAWSKDISLVTFHGLHEWMGSYPEWSRSRLTSLSRELKEGYHLYMLGPFSYHGDYETEGEFWDERETYYISATWLKGTIEGIKAIDPRIKVGLYMTPYFIDQLSKAYLAHPEWVVTNSAGGRTAVGSNRGELYIANPSSGWKGHFLERVRAVADVYDIDWLHIDGGITQDMPEYVAGRAVLPSDTFNKEIREALRGQDSQRILVANYPNSPYSDASYIETRFHNVAAEKLLDLGITSKILQEAKRALIPLYWYSKNPQYKAPRYYTEENYIPFLLGFGFTPMSVFWYGLTPGDPTYYAGPEALSYIRAAYLLRGSEMILSSRATSPLWWKDDSGISTFALKQGNARIVPVTNLGGSSSIALLVNLSEVEMDEELPVFSWLLQPFGQAKYVPLGFDVPDDGTFKKSLVVDGGFSNTKTLILSQVPVFVYSVDGETLPVFLPGTGDVIVNSRKIDSGHLSIEIDAGRNAEILIPGNYATVPAFPEESMSISEQGFKRISLGKGNYNFLLQWRE